jgi:hypothetical protein
MFEKITEIFGATAIHKIAALSATASQVVKIFEQEFANDANAKNAAIDTIIAMLQQQKTM